MPQDCTIKLIKLSNFVCSTYFTKFLKSLNGKHVDFMAYILGLNKAV
jgi:hypothetical protein